MSRVGRELTKEEKVRGWRGEIVRIVVCILCALLDFFLIKSSLGWAKPIGLKLQEEDSIWLAIALLLVCAGVMGVVAIIIVRITCFVLIILYALFSGTPFDIGKNCVMEYRILDSFRLSHLHKECSSEWRTTQFYMVVSLTELGRISRQQWWRLWFMGYAMILQREISLPGLSECNFRICRTTLKSILKEASMRGHYGYIQLKFEFKEHYSRQIVYPQVQLLISLWDVSELMTLLKYDAEIRLESVLGEHIFTKAQLDKYLNKLTDDYEAIEPQLVQSKPRPQPRIQRR